MALGQIAGDPTRHPAKVEGTASVAIVVLPLPLFAFVEAKQIAGVCSDRQVVESWARLRKNNGPSGARPNVRFTELVPKAHTSFGGQKPDYKAETADEWPLTSGH